jgi:hypothetical protein
MTTDPTEDGHLGSDPQNPVPGSNGTEASFLASSGGYFGMLRVGLVCIYVY